MSSVGQTDISSSDSGPTSDQLHNAFRIRWGKRLILVGVPITGTGLLPGLFRSEELVVALAGLGASVAGLYLRSNGWVMPPPKQLTSLRFRDYLFSFAGYWMTLVAYHLFVSWMRYREMRERYPELQFTDVSHNFHAGGLVWVLAVAGTYLSIPALLLGLFLLLTDRSNDQRGT